MVYDLLQATRGNASASVVEIKKRSDTRERGDEKEGSPITDTNILERMADELWQITDTGFPLPPGLVLSNLLWVSGFRHSKENLDTRQMASCINDIEKFVRVELDHFDDNRLRGAAYIFFGLAPGAEGMRITVRKNAAAELMDVTPRTAHKRRREICEKLAWQMYRRAVGRSVF